MNFFSLKKSNTHICTCYTATCGIVRCVCVVCRDERSYSITVSEL